LNFFKKKEKHQIYFTCDEWAIRKYAPIVPAKNFLPPAFNEMPTYIRQEKHAIDSIKTVKSCSGIIDFCSAGFVIPAWCDMEFAPTADGNQVMARYSHKKFNHAVHPTEQVQNLMRSKYSVRVSVRLDNPWRMWAAKGYSLMYFPMHYYDDSRNWEALPGWIDHDVGNVITPINIMLKDIKHTTIKMGEPIVQVIPIKREELLAYTGADNSVTTARGRGLSFLHDMSFSGWIKYMRQKKSYEVDAHDTELPTKNKE
jgi:hypothetical protein